MHLAVEVLAEDGQTNRIPLRYTGQRELQRESCALPNRRSDRTRPWWRLLEHNQARRLRLRTPQAWSQAVSAHLCTPCDPLSLRHHASFSIVGRGITLPTQHKRTSENPI